MFGLFKKKETGLIKLGGTLSGNAVVVKGEKHFDIFQDGNKYYHAKHVSGDWLRDSNSLIDSYQFSYSSSYLEDVQNCAIKYINSRMLTQIGTIEFIPNK